jgi:DNA-binding LacI/PurR family transcriptional regulator
MKTNDPKYIQVERLIEEAVRTLGPGGKMPTVREMKKKFGVSQSTLDHALQKLESRRLITRRQSSGIYADSAVRQRRHSIGVIFPDFSERYHPLLLKGIERELALGDYKTILASSPEALEKEIALIDSVTDSVDGLIIVSRTVSSVDEKYVSCLVGLKSARRIPFVFIDIPVPCVESCYVGFNQRGAFRDAIRLVTSGKRMGQFLFVGLQESIVTAERFIGFKEALLEGAAGALRGKVRLIPMDLDLGAVDLPIKRDAEGGTPVVFVASPLLLPKVMAALRAKGFEVPKDAVVVSVVEEDYKNYILDPVVAIVKPSGDLGALAARTMLGAIAGKVDAAPTRLDLRIDVPEMARKALGVKM